MVISTSRSILGCTSKLGGRYSLLRDLRLCRRRLHGRRHRLRLAPVPRSRVAPPRLPPEPPRPPGAASAAAASTAAAIAGTSSGSGCSSMAASQPGLTTAASRPSSGAHASRLSQRSGSGSGIASIVGQRAARRSLFRDCFRRSRLGPAGSELRCACDRRCNEGYSSGLLRGCTSAPAGFRLEVGFRDLAEVDVYLATRVGIAQYHDMLTAISDRY